MDSIIQTGQFMASAFTQLWEAIGTWGVIGVGIIAPFIFRKIGDLIKKVFQF